MTSATKLDYDMRIKTRLDRMCCGAQKVYMDADHVHCISAQN